MPWINQVQQRRKDVSNALQVLSKARDTSELVSKVFMLLMEELGPRVENLAGNRNKRSAKTRLNYGR